mgnify:CR=1 FL=1
MPSEEESLRDILYRIEKLLIKLTKNRPRGLTRDEISFVGDSE